MDLTQTPWIPTEHGPLTLHEALSNPDSAPLDSGHPMTDSALLRLLALMHARAAGNPEAYLREHHAGLHLFGPRAFMQVPETESRDLLWTNLAGLIPQLPSGRALSTLGPLHDQSRTPFTPDQAALHLITFQASANTNGNTKRGYSSSLPAAAATSFHAHGATLAHDLLLNAPSPDGRPPTWEQAPDWTHWTKSDNTQYPLDGTTASAWPWRTVTLDEPRNGHVWRVRSAAGVKPTEPDAPVIPKPGKNQTPDDLPTVLYTHPDIHTCGHTRGNSGSPTREDPLGTFHNTGMHALRNPPERDARPQLLHAILATFEAPNSGRAPLSFRRALTLGATHVSASALSTNKAVIYDMLRATYPWPRTWNSGVAQAIRDALSGETHLRAIVNTVTPYEKSAYPRAYWDAQNLTLGELLSGEIPPNEARVRIQQALRTFIDQHLTQLINEHPTQRPFTLGRYRAYREYAGDPLPPPARNTSRDRR